MHGGDGRIRPWDAPSRQGNAAGPAAGWRLDTPDSADSGGEAGEATHWGSGEDAGGRISQSAGEQREAPSESHRDPPDCGAVPALLRMVPAVSPRSQRSPVTGPGASGGVGETGSVRRPPSRRPSGRSSPRGPTRKYLIRNAFWPDSECCPLGTRATVPWLASAAEWDPLAGSGAVPWDRSASGTGGGWGSPVPAAGSRNCAMADRLRSCGGLKCLRLRAHLKRAPKRSWSL